ncbi:hypothetical protein MAPG_04667 [Magnaporthiopsis poae ATCC 64411]|uniref:Uncharacterized protein n=1 Tax=Magnaporthiopsis poae (strain ATCC 64411 / 73-15) TaxID=644358 RepID=A0A0C4DXC4_MAGP6|nr:hypothetical protein MAPG_04667 [Magnaporthiopsis poae ATCC 64411]
MAKRIGLARRWWECRQPVAARQGDRLTFLQRFVANDVDAGTESARMGKVDGARHLDSKATIGHVGRHPPTRTSMIPEWLGLSGVHPATLLMMRWQTGGIPAEFEGTAQAPANHRDGCASEQPSAHGGKLDHDKTGHDNQARGAAAEPCNFCVKFLSIHTTIPWRIPRWRRAHVMVTTPSSGPSLSGKNGVDASAASEIGQRQVLVDGQQARQTKSPLLWLALCYRLHALQSHLQAGPNIETRIPASVVMTASHVLPASARR